MACSKVWPVTFSMIRPARLIPRLAVGGAGAGDAICSISASFAT